MKNHFVHTPCGPVQGAAGGADGVSVFRGIRYATAGRWEYPRQVTHWDGVYDAANFGACSFQPRAFYNEEDVPEKAFYYNEFRRGEHYDYSEDCLFLNIWAPDDAKNAPVLFYIHGGGFLGGCGHEKHFDGTAWCKKGVVAVTINYRLGPMGFLCLPELAARDGHTGNYAMFDQMAALCWVRDNIAAFGGDPGQVTLMGQSAGAMSVQQLCVSPMTNGLFRGAVMMSGGGVSRLLGAAQKAEEAYPFWQAVRQKLGAADFAALCGAEPQALFAAFAEARKEQKNPMAGCGPVVDGVFLTESAAEAAKAGRQKNVPYLMGSTSEDVVPPIVHKMAKGWARLQADQGKQPSYAYFFSRQLPGDEKGAWHSADLWYAFGTLDSCWRPFTEWDRALSEAMVSYLTNFAKTGDPNGPGLAEWLPVKKGQTQVLRFGDRDITMGGVSVARLTHTMLTKPNVGE